MKIAIMQPYFIPYAGYFRLIAASDLFIIYDCVQFPRRGWVHRNRLTAQNGELDWLTLPLKKAPQDALIKDLEFAENYQQEWQKRLACFPSAKNNSLYRNISEISGTPLEYIVKTLHTTCELLNIPFNAKYSSQLNLPDNLRGQDRILAINEHFKASEYINSPGGRELYDEKIFSQQSIKLTFLPDYKGNMASIFDRIANESAKTIKDDITSQIAVEA